MDPITALYGTAGLVLFTIACTVMEQENVFHKVAPYFSRVRSYPSSSWPWSLLLLSSVPKGKRYVNLSRPAGEW